MDPIECSHLGLRYWYAFGPLAHRLYWCFALTHEADGGGRWIYAASWGPDGAMITCHGSHGDGVVWKREGRAKAYPDAAAARAGLRILRNGLERHIVATPDWPGEDPDAGLADWMNAQFLRAYGQPMDEYFNHRSVHSLPP